MKIFLCHNGKNCSGFFLKNVKTLINAKSHPLAVNRFQPAVAVSYLILMPFCWRMPIKTLAQGGWVSRLWPASSEIREARSPFGAFTTFTIHLGHEIGW